MEATPIASTTRLTRSLTKRIPDILEMFLEEILRTPCNAEPALKALYCSEVNGMSFKEFRKRSSPFGAITFWPMDTGMLTWYVAWAYTGEYSTHPFNRPWDFVPERDRLDTRLTYEEETGQWEASLFVDNVLDKTYIRSADLEAVEPDMEPTGHIVLSRYILGTSVRSLPITSIDKDLGLEKKRTSVRFFLP